MICDAGSFRRDANRERPILSTPFLQKLYTTSMMSRTVLSRAFRSAARQPVSIKFHSWRNYIKMLTAGTEELCNSSQCIGTVYRSVDFVQWPDGGHGSTAPRTDSYGRCLDRCRFACGNGQDQRHCTLPGAHGVQRHQPTDATRSRTRGRKPWSPPQRLHFEGADRLLREKL